MVEPGTAAVFTPDSDLLGPEASLGFVTGCCQSVCVFFFSKRTSQHCLIDWTADREHTDTGSHFGKKDLKLP